MRACVGPSIHVVVMSNTLCPLRASTPHCSRIAPHAVVFFFTFHFHILPSLSRSCAHQFWRLQARGCRCCPGARPTVAHTRLATGQVITHGRYCDIRTMGALGQHAPAYEGHANPLCINKSTAGMDNGAPWISSLVCLSRLSPPKVISPW
jgi:hypothetical protein